MLDSGNGPALAELALELLALETELVELALDEELDIELETDDNELDTELEELFGSAGTGVSSCLLQPDNRTPASSKHGCQNFIATRREPKIL